MPVDHNRFPPDRAEQNPHILGNLDEITTIFIDRFFNQKMWISEQQQEGNGKWCYKPVLIGNVEPLNEFKAHLHGLTTYGVYSFSNSATCKWICVDIDQKHGLLEGMRLAETWEALRKVLQCLDVCKVPAESIRIEFSGAKGFHVWIFTRETPVELVQRFWIMFTSHLETLPPSVELDLFPNPKINPESSHKA